MSDFPFRTTPYKHQLDCWNLSKDRESFALFMEMGCIAGDAMISLNRFGNSVKWPLSKLNAWWNGNNHHRDWLGPAGIKTRSHAGGILRLNEIINVHPSGVKELVTIVLASGKILSLTPEHEVLTTDGMVSAEALLDHEVLTNITKQEWDERKIHDVRPPTPPCAICGNPDSTSSPKSRYYGWCRSCIMCYVSKNSDGRTIDKDGYIRICGYRGHSRANASGQILEHIVVMEKKLGRELTEEERVHHIDENPKNNASENLELRTKHNHGEKHTWFRNLRQDVFTPVKDQVVRKLVGGRKETFDIVMSSPNNNFIANGIIVHNCGKSKVVIDNAAYLYLEEKIEGQVVIAPKGVYLNWVESELPTHMSPAVRHEVAYWSSYANKEEREALRKLHEDGKFLRTLVVNIEALNSERATKELVQFMEKYRNITTIDESTTIKNPNAKRTKIAINIGKYAQYRRICSGNPMPNGPLDLYSQSEFLRKNQLGFANYFAFRNRFAVMQEQKFGSRSFKSVVGYKDKEYLKKLMRQFSFVIKKDDCLDLPPKVYQTVDIAMGPKQTEAYNKMLQDAYFALEDGTQLTAQMVITQLLRLHQISCGFLKPDFGEEQPFPEANERLETLMDLLEAAPGKVIIWATYRYNIAQIINAISEKFGPQSVVDYYGDTDDEDRRKAKRSFQDPESPVRFIVSNPETGKFGNTWTLATTVIYYSNTYNLESREQSEDRAHRIGQVGAVHKPGEDPSVLYIDLRARGTVDDKIIRVLKNKKKLTDEIVASNWQWLLGEKAA